MITKAAVDYLELAALRKRQMVVVMGKKHRFVCAQPLSHEGQMGM